jgi:hypothetical protein
MSALNIIRKKFPEVERVRDSRRTIVIRVKPIDTTSGRKKDPASCALARACVREQIADAAIIGIGYSWLIKGKVATRYKTSTGVGREITSFDRHQDFAAGSDYKLSRVAPSARMNKYKGNGGPHKTKRDDSKTVVHHHHTANIRVIRKVK